MQQKLLIWSLIAFLPLAGIRMVCIERPHEGAAIAADQPTANCDQFCPRQNAPGNAAANQEPSREDAADHATDCALFADGSLTVLVSGVAVLPAPPPVQFTFATLRFQAEVHDFYLAPVLTHHTPPPKA